MAKKNIINLYKIKAENIIKVVFITIMIKVVEVSFKHLFKYVLDVHLGLNYNADYLLNVYIAFLSLLLPVAILIIEIIKEKNNEIPFSGNLYLKETYIFPVIVYFVANLILLTAFKDQYYFFLSFGISLFVILYVCYKSFKIISNSIYEKDKISELEEEMIKEDFSNIKKYKMLNNNMVEYYTSFGIINNNYPFYAGGYERLNIQTYKGRTGIIENYNEKKLKHILREMEDINSGKNDQVMIGNQIKNINCKEQKNVIIKLHNIGKTIKNGDIICTVYYKEEYCDFVKKIMNMIDDNVYIISSDKETLNINKAYESVENRCVEAINSGSSNLLSRSLDEYYDIYKKYVDCLPEKDAAETENISKDLNLFSNINDCIYDFTNMVVINNNHRLLLVINDFFYKLILYSNEKKQIEPIKYFYSNYAHLVNMALESENKAIYEKIQLQILEFMKWKKYYLKQNDEEFATDILLLINKNIGNIILTIFNKKDFNLFLEFYKRLVKFIQSLKSDIEYIEEVELKEKIENVYKHYICNNFAITAFLINNKDINPETRNELLSYYKLDAEELTKVFLDTLNLYYDNHEYSWSLLEFKNTSDDIVADDNTRKYLIKLYCLFLTKYNVSECMCIKSSYELSRYVDEINKELESMGKKKYQECFKKISKDIIDQKQHYLRNTKISKNKVEKFKEDFKDKYATTNKLYLLFKETDNVKTYENKIKNSHNPTINNIVDKTYFLEKFPYNETIIFINFVETFVNAFIKYEKEKFTEKLEEKSEYNENDLISYLNKLSVNKLEKSILFASYDAFHNIIDNKYVTYKQNTRREINYADFLVTIKDINIPLIIINKDGDEFIYHSFNNSIGTFIKTEFNITVDDFLDNERALDKIMGENIEGCDLQGEDKKKYLLERVKINIDEKVKFNDNKLKAQKFDH